MSKTTQWLIFSTLIALPTLGLAQQSATTEVVAIPAAATLPTELSGRWYTADNRYSQTWKISKINQVAGTALVTWNSTVRSCYVLVDVPARIEYDGATLKVTFVDYEKYRLCTNSFVAELKRNGNEFEGKVWPGNNTNPAYSNSYAITTIK